MNDDAPILIAEDSEDYALLLKTALKQAGRLNGVHVVSDGDEAIKYLRGEEKYGDREAYAFPSVLFLDLRMPGADGFDVLQWMRDNPGCRVTPTLVLSSSVLEQDVEKAYELGANAYLGKPAEFAELKTMVKDAEKFWSWCVKPETHC